MKKLYYILLFHTISHLMIKFDIIFTIILANLNIISNIESDYRAIIKIIIDNLLLIGMYMKLVST